MTDLEYIKSFTSIQVTKVCKKLKIDYSNLISGRSSKKNENLVRKELESEFAKLYINRNELKEGENIERIKV